MLARIAIVVLSLIAGFASAEPALTIVTKGETVTLSRADLESLPQTSITTTSPYFEGAQEFSGPSLQLLVDTYKRPEHTRIQFRALNNYAVDVATGDAFTQNAVLATRREGKTMSVRNQGPFWLMLPLSDLPELDNEDSHRLMIWQLSEIEFK